MEIETIKDLLKIQENLKTIDGYLMLKITKDMIQGNLKFN